MQVYHNYNLSIRKKDSGDFGEVFTPGIDLGFVIKYSMDEEGELSLDILASPILSNHSVGEMLENLGTAIKETFKEEEEEE